MSAKKTKSTVSKEKVKKHNAASPEESVTGPAHPDYILPLVLTSITQEMFGCRADQDVTEDRPYKLLKKEDIVRDMRTRAAVSDFSPAKQAVLDYPEQEMLLVFDRDFTYGQSFYLVLTTEAKLSILKPPAEAEEEEDEEDDELDVALQKTPEPQTWVSLGSERDVEEESVRESRPPLCCKISRERRAFGAPVNFTDCNAADVKSDHVKSYRDERFSIRRVEVDCGLQAVPKTKDSSSQTTWKFPKNMWTQYEPRELGEEEKQKLLQSKNLKNFLNSVSARLELALQQNHLLDVFVDEWSALGDEDAALGARAHTHLKEYQSFTHLHHRGNKSISHVQWHPTISGVVAVSLTERMTYEERMENSTRLLLSPALILIWSFSDPINPQLLLECPDDVLCFQFCPSNPNIMVGGCMSGQVVLWDVSAHMDRLQGVGGKIPNSNTLKSSAPVVRYCAVSGIEGGHKAPITDIQWLPDTFEVSRTGIPLENKEQVAVQIVTCAPDCCVLFWDLRTPRVAVHSQTDRKQKAEEKLLENPHGVPNTFKHLNLTWKPLFKVTLPRVDSSGEYSPMRFSLRGSYTAAGKDKSACVLEKPPAVPEYSSLRVPSAKHLRPLQHISTKLYIGTEDGELVYTDWKLEKDNDSGRLFSPKPSHRFRIHDSIVNTVLRSPFFNDITLTVGGWKFAVWKEGVMKGPLLVSSCSPKCCSAAFWSPTRPSVFFIGKEDGQLEVWDLLEKTHEPSETQNVSSAQITCIRPCNLAVRQQLLAVSDHLGTLHILEVPRSLRQPSTNEKQAVEAYFNKEVERLSYCEKRKETRAREKREREAEEARKKMEPVVVMKQEEELDEEEQKEFEEFCAQEKLILKEAGLLSETHHITDI